MNTGNPATATADPDTHLDLPVLRVVGGRIDAAPTLDQLAVEAAVAIEYNGISYATMLLTPADLDDFALGFSLTEGIIGSRHDVRDIDVEASCDGYVVRMEIATARMVRLKERRRALAGRTGCGLCGVETLGEVVRPIAPVTPGPALRAQALFDAQYAMRSSQHLHTLTGATHGAGWASLDGTLQLVREDVGRHNALDKLIGALARADTDPTQGLAVVSSRASFEMVQKSAAAGISVLAAVSAPTALAVSLAERLGVTLVGFLRDTNCTLYAHAARVLPSSS